jgi:subtilisin-like proprotein convertase family protein
MAGFALAPAASAQTAFDNFTAINVPSSGTASPYPSSIVVSSMTGTISKVTVTLNGISHTFPDDLDILLVGPTGANLLILSDVGGGSAASGLTLTLDDAAASMIADAGPLASGTFKPTAVTSGAADNFPAPGPGSPSNAAAPSGVATLASVFNGSDPNGTWKLFVVDDLLGDSGSLSGGWTITITTVAAPPTTTAVTSSANPSQTGGSVTFTATVTDGGTPVTTGNVTFTEGATVLQAATPVNASGQVAFTTSGLAEGSHLITASYGGNANNGPSSGSVTQVVDNVTTVNGNTFCNDASGITVPTSGTGSPYPSHILVTGLSGSISKVTVQLKNVTHGFPDDLGVLLVGPGGQHLDFLSDAGGNSPATTQTLTFDDAAASAVPDAGPLVTGTFRPTAIYSTPDSFPSPGPGTPTNIAAPFGTATLASVFNASSPNGTWSLDVVDDSPGGTGSIGGWCLTFTTTADAPTTTVLASSKNPAFTGDSVTFTATVTSSGSPVTAGTVTFREGATVLAGPTALNGSGQASFSTSSLVEGSHLIVATYNGSPGVFNTSSGSLTETIDNHTQQTGNLFCNPGAVTIADSGAHPYPSRIFVAGLGGSGTVKVSFPSLTHTFPDDIDVLLVGPTGANLLLLSDVGGSLSASGVNLTLDDGAASLLPDAGPLSSGTFRPTDVGSGSPDGFPAPGPGSPANTPAPFGSATLASVFGGVIPNGTWSLYVVDDTGGNAGSLGGWCLNFVGATSTAVTSSLNPSTQGQSVTFTATVTSGGVAVSTGTVTFREGATTLQAATPVNGSGQVTFTTSSLTPGSHTITADYTGASPAVGSSGNVVQTVNAPTATVVGSSVNPSFTGQSVTFTATVMSGGSPVTTGTVTFREGATTLQAATALDAGGQVTFTTSSLTAGGHTITADYGGAPGLAASSGNLLQTVNAPATTSTVVVSSLNPSMQGQSVTFTATVTSGGSPVTTGTVTFREGATTLQAATAVDASGQVGYTTSGLGAGNHTITADYSGALGFAPSSGSVVQSVKASAGTLVPDGRAVRGTLTVNGDAYRTTLVAARSYSVDVEAPFDGEATVAGGPAPQLSVTRADGTPLSTAPAVRTACAPALASSAPQSRLTFTPSSADVAGGPLSIHVDDPVSSGYAYRIRLAETTMYAPRWSINGYQAFISIQNTGPCPVLGQVVLLDSSGATVTTLPFSLAGQAATQILIPPQPVLFGSARLLHDGAPGSITAGVYMVQGLGPTYRWPFAETRASESTDGR